MKLEIGASKTTLQSNGIRILWQRNVVKKGEKRRKSISKMRSLMLKIRLEVGQKIRIR